MGCHFLLQVIFPTQGSNLCLLCLYGLAIVNSAVMNFRASQVPGSRIPGKETYWIAGDLGLIPGLGRSPEEGNGNPLQYSCLKKPMDRGAWQVTVHGVAKSRT